MSDELQGLDREIDKLFKKINFLEDVVEQKMDQLELLKKRWADNEERI